jgi:hypothetical protein
MQYKTIQTTATISRWFPSSELCCKATAYTYRQRKEGGHQGKNLRPFLCNGRLEDGHTGQDFGHGTEAPLSRKDKDERRRERKCVRVWVGWGTEKKTSPAERKKSTVDGGKGKTEER